MPSPIPEAVAFCRRTHLHANVRFEIGDVERLPIEDQSMDAVTNIESSHTYPNLRSFFVEVFASWCGKKVVPDKIQQRPWDAIPAV